MNFFTINPPQEQSISSPEKNICSFRKKTRTFEKGKKKHFQKHRHNGTGITPGGRSSSNWCESNVSQKTASIQQVNEENDKVQIYIKPQDVPTSESWQNKLHNIIN